MKIRVSVKANCSEARVLGVTDSVLRIELTSRPLKNQANKELIKVLAKHFKKSVKISSGLTSSLKTVVVED